MKKIDYLLIGPSFPYRGGIAQTQNEFALNLLKLGKNIEVFTFKKLYPKFLFPGKTQFTSEGKPSNLKIKINIHSYNPFNWIKIGKEINKIKPKYIIFRYYTPLLALCYVNIISYINKDIKSIALVDNWTPHEPKFYDNFFNKLFSKKIDSYITLSNKLALELKIKTKSRVFSGFHPISENLPKIISKKKARKKLGWDPDIPIVLFYGLIRSYKGLDNLLRAFANPPLSLSKAKLGIVGEFYEPIDKYQLLIKKLKLEKNIYLIPKYANMKSTQLYFSSADVIALTYKSATQSGVIPIAYHFLTPILVTDLIGLKTPILKDKSGLICSQKPHDISHKLSEMLIEDRKEFFQKNIKKSVKKYSWAEYSKQVTNFIENKN
jgi:glycosyltransferase involved in cell wall biosynthesis